MDEALLISFEPFFDGVFFDAPDDTFDGVFDGAFDDRFDGVSEGVL